MSMQLNAIRTKVTELFTSLRPDVVITWGPSGWTGHPDHRMVGAVVSEVFASKVWGKPSNLYYPELVSGSIEQNPWGVATVDSAYLPVRITVQSSDFTKAKASHDCHKSQYTPEAAASLQKLAWNAEKGIFFFRPFIMKGNGRQTSLLK